MSIFNIYKLVRPRAVIKSADFNGLQSALKVSIDSIGSPVPPDAPAGSLGVGSALYVGDALTDDQAVNVRVMNLKLSDNEVQAAAALASQIEAAAQEDASTASAAASAASAVESANSATASANSATASAASASESAADAATILTATAVVDAQIDEAAGSATASAASAATAANYAAGLNIPPVVIADKGKVLTVAQDGTGYELKPASSLATLMKFGAV